jgi:putative spermidine/putrescine transport system substrate-binding protein
LNDTVRMLFPRPRFVLLVSFLALFLSVFVVQAGSPRVLRVLTWPGYADQDVVRKFEQRHGVRVEVVEIDSDTALWERMQASDGRGFDVFAVNTAELQRYIDAGMVQPINRLTLKNLHRQLPRFQNVRAIPGLTRDGQVYGIPYTYAEMGLIYDRKQFSQPPDSINILWDKRLQGRILAYAGAAHGFSLAAQSLGAKTPFRILEGDWPRMVDRLIELRRNVLGFYTQPEESVALFRSHQIAVLFANYGTQQLRLLRAAGLDVGYVIPREGALAWLDCWVIARGATDRALVDAWLDYMLEPEVSGLLVSRQGLANTIAEASESLPQDKLIWLEPYENVVQREQLWARILSGDRARRVLAP